MLDKLQWENVWLDKMSCYGHRNIEVGLEIVKNDEKMLQNNSKLDYLASNYIRIFNLQNEAFCWITSFPRYSLNSLRLVLF